MVQDRNMGAPRRVVEVVQDRHGNLIEIFDLLSTGRSLRTHTVSSSTIIWWHRRRSVSSCLCRAETLQPEPSHKLFRGIIDGVLDPKDYHIVIFGTCGTVPAELECMYPFRNYHYMLGKTTDGRIRRDFHRIEVYRLKGYLEKTQDAYRHRLAYCIGPFRKAMVEASEETGSSSTCCLPTR